MKTQFILTGCTAILFAISSSATTTREETKFDPPMLHDSFDGNPIPTTRCGQAAKTETVVAERNTSNERVATQLGWRENGPNNWHGHYSFSVTAPALNFPPHRGRGNGSYFRIGSVDILCTERKKRTVTVSDSGVVISSTPWVSEGDFYSYQIKDTRPAVYIPCSHDE